MKLKCWSQFFAIITEDVESDVRDQMSPLKLKLSGAPNHQDQDGAEIKVKDVSENVGGGNLSGNSHQMKARMKVSKTPEETLRCCFKMPLHLV